MNLQSAKDNGPISQSREHRQYSPKLMDPTLPILSVFGILGHYLGRFGGPGSPQPSSGSINFAG